MRLLSQWPETAIIDGDFNAGNQIWGSATMCRNETTIEQITYQTGLCFFRYGQATHFWQQIGGLYAIDKDIMSVHEFPLSSYGKFYMIFAE